MNIQEELQKPFESRDIEWRIGRSGEKKGGGCWAMALAYLTNRAIMNRLDEVIGFANWKNEFREWKAGEQTGVLCGLSIKMLLSHDRNLHEWVTKWDGAGNTDFEAIKGGLSDSMKRAAVQWGIGRYLYNLEENFVECSEKKGQGDWKYAKTKEGVSFFWKPPVLPDWALPKIQAPSPLVSCAEFNVLTGLLSKYEFEESRFLTWASKAAKHDVVSLAQLPKSLFEKAVALLKAEGEKVPV